MKDVVKLRAVAHTHRKMLQEQTPTWTFVFDHSCVLGSVTIMWVLGAAGKGYC